MKVNSDELDVKQLEAEFNAVVEDLKQDTGLSKFKREYEFLFQALQASNERVNSHILQFQKLKEGMLIDTYGVETALHQTENDETLKKKLVGQIDQIKKMIESLRERDEKNQARIELHKTNIAQINQTIKNWQILNNGDEEIIDRQNAVERLKAEIEFIRGKIDSVQQQSGETKTRLTETVGERQTAQTIVAEQKVKLGNWQKRLEEQDRTRTCEIKEIEGLKKEREQLNSERAAVIEKQKQLKGAIEKLQAAKLETTKKIKHSEKENARLYKTEVEMAKRFDDLIELNRLIEKEVGENEEKTVSLEKEVHMLQDSIEKAEKALYSREERLKDMQAEIKEEKRLQVSLRDQIEDAERICEEIRITSESDAKRAEELMRETNLLRDFLNKVGLSNADKTDEISRAEKENDLCNSRFNSLKKQQSVLMSEMKVMKDENVKLLKDISITKTKQGVLDEELRLKGELIGKYSTSLAHLTVKLKQQQALYENVKRDKLLYSKQLAETQSEIVELRRRYKTLVQNISTLKEEIERKEEDLTKEYFKTKDLEKNCEAQVKTNDLLSNYLRKKDVFFQELSDKIADLKLTIDNFNTQKDKINEQLEIVISERDLLSTEVIKRHKELRTLNEKLVIIDHLSKKSEKQFGIKATLSVSLKKTSRELLMQIKGIKVEVERIPELFIDYQLLEKEYFNEKLKCNFLIQELQCPLNVHKWRKLESTDNKAFELLSKVYALTKSLLSKNEIAVSNRNEGEEVRKEIEKVKVALSRKPTALEVEMCEKMKLKTVELDLELDELEHKVVDSKSKFFESEFHVKRLEDDLRSVKLQLSEAVRVQIIAKNNPDSRLEFLVKPSPKRRLGGGFLVKTK